MAYEGQRPLAGPTTSSPRHSRVKPAPGARSDMPEIVPRARSLERASVRGAMKRPPFLVEYVSTRRRRPPLCRGGAAFEFGLLMLVTRTRG